MRRDTAFNGRDVAHAGLAGAPEGLDAEVFAGGDVAEDDGAAGQAVEEDIEPAVAGDHGAGDAEVSEVGS